MKMKTIPALLFGSILFLAAAPHAAVIYYEIFNSGGADNVPMTNINWNANYGSSGTTYNGTDGTVAPIISGNDYIWQKLASGAGPTLAWTDNASFGAISSITNVSMSVHNDSSAEDLQIALKVDGSWYVSQNVLNGSGFVAVNLAVQSALWNSLAFVEGTTLAEGSSSSLPSSGTLQAVGVFNASAIGNASVRVDDFMVEGIPKPFYLETFDSEGVNFPLTNINWNANYGSSGMTYTGTDGTVAPIHSGGGYIWQKLASGAGPTLAWTDNASFGAIGSITNVSMSLRNDSSVEDLQVALKVDGSWYVSRSVLNGSGFATVNLAVQSASWNSLAFAAGTTLVEGGAASFPLTGILQAVGVFNADAIGNASVRVDNFTVEAILGRVFIGASDDSWVNGWSSYAGTNYGNSQNMNVRYENASWGNNASLAKFDLSILPENIVINSVRMRFYTYLNNWSGSQNFVPVGIFQNMQNWNESTVCWNNAPTTTATAVEELDHFGLIGINEVYFTGENTISSGGWLEYSAESTRALVQEWSNGSISNYGVRVMGVGDFVDAYRMFLLQTKESGAQVRPMLIVDYEPAVPGQINVKARGAVGDGHADDTIAILNAISEANTLTDTTTVYFPSGTYRICSTNEFALQLNNITNVHLKGAGTNSVLLVSNPKNGAISFVNSENVKLEGFVLDFDPLPYTQGTITSVNVTNGSFQIQLDSGYPQLSYDFFANADMKWGITVDEAQGTYGAYAYSSSNWCNISERLWQMQLDDPVFMQSHPLSVGDRYVHLARGYHSDITFDACANVEVKDVNVYATSGLAVGFEYSHGIVVDGLDVGLKPGTSRLISSNGDGVHSSGCSSLVIENCSFDGMVDDVINIHGRGGRIIDNVSDTVKWVGTTSTSDHRFYEGDYILIYDYVSGGSKSAIIQSISNVNSYVWQFELDRPLPNLNVGWATGDKVSNLSLCGQNSVIRNNIFGSHRARDILLRSHDITVENNYFCNPSSGYDSISLDHEYAHHEGPASYRITILGNIFLGGGNLSDPAIGIRSRLAGGMQSSSYDSSDITICNNTFSNLNGYAVDASSSIGVELISNSVTSDYGVKVSLTPVVRFGNANDIYIDDLYIKDPNPETYAGIHIMDSVGAGVDITNCVMVLHDYSEDVQDDRY